jgi:hypothetical protein
MKIVGFRMGRDAKSAKGGPSFQSGKVSRKDSEQELRVRQ